LSSVYSSVVLRHYFLVGTVRLIGRVLLLHVLLVSAVQCVVTLLEASVAVLVIHSESWDSAHLII
jgi:hypothetical protein